jgi:excisionase family DNA binding protein
MDELEIQGKKLISSKRAAEITGYAKDYIGQLIRAGKIQGIRFGRAWFVDEDEVKAHAGLIEAEKIVAKSSIEKYIAAPVGTPLARPHVKLLPSGEFTSTRLPSTWSKIQYSHEDEEVIPRLSEKAEISLEKSTEILSQGDSRLTPTFLNSARKNTSEPKVVSNIERDRMKVLVDGIAPRSAVMRVAAPQLLPQPSQKPKSLPQIRSIAVPMIPAAAVGVFAILGLILGLSGLIISSEATYVAGNEVYTANVLAGFENISPVFAEGSKAVTDFLKNLGSSFTIYIDMSINFFQGIF